MILLVVAVCCLAAIIATAILCLASAESRQLRLGLSIGIAVFLLIAAGGSAAELLGTRDAAAVQEDETEEGTEEESGTEPQSETSTDAQQPDTQIGLQMNGQEPETGENRAGGLQSEPNGAGGLQSESNGAGSLQSESNGAGGLQSESNGAGSLQSGSNGAGGLQSGSNGAGGLQSESGNAAGSTQIGVSSGQ